MTSVSRQLVSQFAECLRAELAAEPPGAPEPAPAAGESAQPAPPAARAPAKPVGGISLLLRALWDRLLRLLRCAAHSGREGDEPAAAV